ncbi:homoserine dehydrogenase [uncultured Nevskia sp.]|uniref:homoserine dehydrogenase n=1 Tax=uncultured Nevskia sp. TaxID=228950 RepID=UPI0025F5C676|nr:homoserine dehydrogenase [uncultured Nevskia sp.]
MSEPLKVGIVGLGTVGQGVVRVLQKNAAAIAARAGRAIVVTDVSVRNAAASRDCSLAGIRVHATPEAVVAADVDVICELIGGTDLANDLILAALAGGKSVVTANKALIAEKGNALIADAQARGLSLAFEAAVAGGIPIIKVLREGLTANDIDSLAGIINGTSNYILTQMTVKGQSFADALKDAQKLGYAEADPTFDVEGIDAAHKLTILASIAFGTPLNFAAVSTEGLSKVQAEDIQLARELGYRIKSLGIAKRSEHGVELRVHPTLVPDDHLLAKTDGALNAVRVHGNAVGQTVYVGRGAGGEPTASAVIADLVDIARLNGAAPVIPALGFTAAALAAQPTLGIEAIESAYYLRLTVADEPGVLRALTTILADADISVEAILQKEPEDHEDARIAIITSVISGSRFDAALERIRALPFVRPDMSRLRVEHFE